MNTFIDGSTDYDCNECIYGAQIQILSKFGQLCRLDTVYLRNEGSF